MAISKRTRFEVFKRDSFTCQYCGQKAPDVVLQVDHIEPRSLEGSDEILNLVTSCEECNSGKSNVRLSDDSVIQKQRRQSELLQQQREQLEMMMEWQRGLLDLETVQIEELAGFWERCVAPFYLTDVGRVKLRKLIRQFGVAEVVEAMRIATAQYAEHDGGGNLTAESVDRAWHKVGGVCVVRNRERQNPDLKDIYYIRGILRRRLNYVNEREVVEFLQDALDAGIRPYELREDAVISRSWSQFCGEVRERMGVI